MTKTKSPGGIARKLAAFSLALAVMGGGLAAAQEYYVSDGSTYVTSSDTTVSTLPGKPTTLYNLDGTVYAQGYTTPDGQLIYDVNGATQTVPSTASYSGAVTYYDPSVYSGTVVYDSTPTVIYDTSPTYVYDSGYYYDDFYRPSWGWGWGGSNYYWDRPSYRPPRPPHRPPPGGPGIHPRPPKPPPGGGIGPRPPGRPRPPAIGGGSGGGRPRPPFRPGGGGGGGGGNRGGGGGRGHIRLPK